MARFPGNRTSLRIILCQFSTRSNISSSFRYFFFIIILSFDTPPNPPSLLPHWQQTLRFVVTINAKRIVYRAVSDFAQSADSAASLFVLVILITDCDICLLYTESAAHYTISNWTAVILNNSAPNYDYLRNEWCFPSLRLCTHAPAIIWGAVIQH